MSYGPKVDQATASMSAGKGTMDLLAHLVAARARAGTHDRDNLAAPSDLTQSTDALLEDSRGQPAPAGVERRHGAAGPEHDWDAVGGEDHRRQARRAERVTVGFKAGLASRVLALEDILDTEPLAICEQASDHGPVNLIATHQAPHAE